MAAVRGPDERLMSQVREGVAAIQAEVDINVACSLGMLTQEQVDELAAIGVHRYNHNLESARSYFGNVVTTHSFEERWETCEMVRKAGMELCCGGIVGMGETVEQRAEFAAQLAELDPDEVPLNFLNPRPGTPFGDAASRCRPSTRCAPSRRSGWSCRARSCASPAAARSRSATWPSAGVRGGVNAVIVGNYLTTLGRPGRARTSRCSPSSRCRSRRSPGTCECPTASAAGWACDDADHAACERAP